ncbi:GTPase ObgE [Candidatus Desantisbacteria bacterium]|nr:GTPase ObgE [Candidatus Desantisbacteria bacterium]
MFIDHAVITVLSGNGGNGCVSFRREKFVPRGGPNGGDGGSGGNVIIKTSSTLHSLLDFRYRPKMSARNGEHGKGKNMHGKNGENIIIKVPCGTVIYENDSGKKIKDLTTDGEEILVCKGGRGGFGNTHFTTSTNQSPRLAEKGEPGEEKILRLELKLIADIGLVGYPNVGKSTLISKISEAHPKIADYPFTTLTPNLGVVKMKNWRTFVVADIPGLIEGAHKGAGLGIEFLKHIERTRLLLHIIDMSGLEGRDPWEDFKVINNELKLYSEKLLNKIQIIAANKMDLPAARENYEKLEKKFKRLKYNIFPISGATGEGINELLKHLASSLDSLPNEEETDEEEEIIEFKPRFYVEKVEDTFIIHGKEVEKWTAMTDFENSEAVDRLQKIFQRMGLENELKEKGIKSNSKIKVKDIEFNYFDI